MEKKEFVPSIYEAEKKKKIRVMTKAGWTSDMCHFTCSYRNPGGLWVTKKGRRCFVPFDSIDHIEEEE